jgi:hypothetical protein
VEISKTGCFNEISPAPHLDTANQLSDRLACRAFKQLGEVVSGFYKGVTCFRGASFHAALIYIHIDIKFLRLPTFSTQTGRSPDAP